MGVFVTQSEIRNSNVREVAFSLSENEVSKPFKVNLLEKRMMGQLVIPLIMLGIY